ncbi:Uncharacterised protein [Mycobacterium tuberculosis]|nr:Uncharacterised protein [Mycobacterium tuberculosis]CPA12615.1 Uncharacterised protein [Mycobacterium tuberculosis]
MAPSGWEANLNPSPTMASGSSLPVVATMTAKSTPYRLSPTIRPVASMTPNRFLRSSSSPDHRAQES